MQGLCGNWRLGGAIGLLGLAGLACALAATPALAQSVTGPAGIYTCTDAQGRRHTADRQIAECLDREQRVLGPTGVERRRVGPALTPSERAAQEAQRRQQLQAEQQAREETRRQRALHIRYPDKAAHEAERAAALAQIDEMVALALKRNGELRAQRQKLDTEMEFYAKDPARAPAPLRRQLEQSDEALADHARWLVAQEQEKRRVHQRFDAELAQLRQLWGATP